MKLAIRKAEITRELSSNYSRKFTFESLSEARIILPGAVGEQHASPFRPARSCAGAHN